MPKPQDGTLLSWTAHHILSASSTMVGVNATLIGLVKIVEGRIGPSRVDEFSGLAALLFLVAALTSYVSVRTATRPALSQAAAVAADVCFMAGLIGMAGIAVFFAYELI